MGYYQSQKYFNKGSKYSAQKETCRCGHLHDSRKEARRCDELNILLKAGKITDLEFQKKYLIIPAIYKTVTLKEVYKIGNKKGQHKTKTVCDEAASYYIADFVYFDKELNKNVIEDTKGMKTKEYILKRKLVKNLFCSDNSNTVFLET